MTMRAEGPENPTVKNMYAPADFISIKNHQGESTVFEILAKVFMNTFSYKVHIIQLYRTILYGFKTHPYLSSAQFRKDG